MQASAVIIMWVESREWMKLGGKALPCLAASGVVLVPFWMRTFCSTVQIDWSSCTVTAFASGSANGESSLDPAWSALEGSACVRLMA